MSNSASPARTRSILHRLCIAAALIFFPTLALASPKNLPGIIDEARKAVAAKQYEEATKLYTEAWHMRAGWQAIEFTNGGPPGADTSLKIHDSLREMGTLARTYPPAREAFMQLRAIAERELLKDFTDPQELWDLVSLNEKLGIEDSNILIFDELRKTHAGRTILDQRIFAFERLLVKKNRWADLGEIYMDPLNVVTEQAESLARAKQIEKERGNRSNISSRFALERIGILYASLLAAQRENDAEKVAKHIMDSDPDPRVRVALAEAALRAGQSRPIHLEWCTTAGQEGLATDGLIIQIKRDLEKFS